MIRRLVTLLATAGAAVALAFVPALPALPAAADTASTVQIVEESSGQTDAQSASSCANCWVDSAAGVKVYSVQTASGHPIAKIVIAPQYWWTSASTDLHYVGAVRTRCSIRNLDGNYILGVSVNQCALGQTGGATLTLNSTPAPQINCCSDSFAPLRYACYVTTGIGFLGRGTIDIRYADTGTVDRHNWYSNSTGHTWSLSTACI